MKKAAKALKNLSCPAKWCASSVTLCITGRGDNNFKTIPTAAAAPTMTKIMAMTTATTTTIQDEVPNYFVWYCGSWTTNSRHRDVHQRRCGRQQPRRPKAQCPPRFERSPARCHTRTRSAVSAVSQHIYVRRRVEGGTGARNVDYVRRAPSGMPLRGDETNHSSCPDHVKNLFIDWPVCCCCTT